MCRTIAEPLAERGGFSVSRGFGGFFSPLNSISMKWVFSVFFLVVLMCCRHWAFFNSDFGFARTLSQ